MEIKIVGAGCDKCDTLYENTNIAVTEMGLTDVTVTKIEDLMEMVMMGIMTVPALVIDGKTVFAGSALKVDKIKSYIQKAL